jgi:hypothetical protein
LLIERRGLCESAGNRRVQTSKRANPYPESLGASAKRLCFFGGLQIFRASTADLKQPIFPISAPYTKFNTGIIPAVEIGTILDLRTN